MVRLLSLIVLSRIVTLAQIQWTTPVQITFGLGDDTDASIAGEMPNGFTSTQFEWLAYTHAIGTSKQIRVARTFAGASGWLDSVYHITSDALTHSSPRIGGGANAWSPSSYPQKLVVVWQANVGRESAIFYSTSGGGAWSNPQPVASLPGVNTQPDVSVRDSTFGVVWSHEGRIMFTEYRNNAWTPLERITPVDDSLNSFPKIGYFRYGFPEGPIVAWEHSKGVRPANTIHYSLRTGTGWTAFDTIATSFDNRHAEFVRGGWSGDIIVTYESNRTGNWEIYAARGYASSNTMNWFYRDQNVSLNPTADDRHARFTLPSIITSPPSNPEYIPYTAGAWQVSTATSDSIRGDSWRSDQPAYLSPAPGSIDRNPDLSGGVYALGGLRVWAVWENNSMGSWKLFGSSAVIPLDGVDELREPPAQPILYQNYPNPFNPVTTLIVGLPEHTAVSLKVFDMLGKEVAVLAEGQYSAGAYRFYWDGRKFSGGVYFCKMQTNGGVQTVKMLLMK